MTLKFFEYLTIKYAKSFDIKKKLDKDRQKNIGDNFSQDWVREETLNDSSESKMAFSEAQVIE